MKTLPFIISLVGLSLNLVCAQAADAPTERRSPLYPNQPTDEQQKNALKALSKARKEVSDFVYLFPDSGFRMYPPDKKGAATIAIEAKDRDWIILKFEGRFSSNYAEISDVRFVSLDIVFDQLIYRGYTKPSELAAFLDSPEAFMAAVKKTLTPADIPKVIEVRKVK